MKVLQFVKAWVAAFVDSEAPLMEVVLHTCPTPQYPLSHVAVVDRGTTVYEVCTLSETFSHRLSLCAMRMEPTTEGLPGRYYQWFNGETLVASGMDSPEEGVMVDVHQEDIVFEGPPAMRIIEESIDAGCLGVPFVQPSQWEMRPRWNGETMILSDGRVGITFHKNGVG